MKKGKAADPDELVIEQMIASDIYETGIDVKISITLPKKPGTIECEQHRTICLVSQITKILLRILMTN